MKGHRDCRHANLLGAPSKFQLSSRTEPSSRKTRNIVGPKLPALWWEPFSWFLRSQVLPAALPCQCSLPFGKRNNSRSYRTGWISELFRFVNTWHCVPVGGPLSIHNYRPYPVGHHAASRPIRATPSEATLLFHSLIASSIWTTTFWRSLSTNGSAPSLRPSTELMPR